MTNWKTAVYTSDDDRLFISQLDDAVYLCEKRRKPYFFSFMSERKQSLASKHLDYSRFSGYRFFGGYEGAERRVLCLWFDSQPDDAEFPVDALEFSFRKSDKLTHRDFLGAIMALGIERETVGDILVEDGSCVVFVKREIKEYITSQLSKIGSAGVKISEFTGSGLPKGRGAEEISATVSSLRLDSVAAALSGLSREKTKSLILSGIVAHNYEGCTNISKPVREGDIITIRGKGKFQINGVLGETKKHRIRLSILHYR